MAWVAWRRLADPVWLWRLRNPTTGAAPWPFSIVWLPKPLHDAARLTPADLTAGQALLTAVEAASRGRARELRGER